MEWLKAKIRKMKMRGKENDEIEEQKNVPPAAMVKPSKNLFMLYPIVIFLSIFSMYLSALLSNCPLL